MLSKDDMEKYEYERDLAEYLASFWNAESVAKVRESRETLSDDRFMSDEEFDKKIQSGDFGDIEMLKRIKEKYSPTNLNTTNDRVSGRDARLPSDKTSISDLINKKFND